jgi:hypothetical protein
MIVFLSTSVTPQEKLPESEQWININKDMMYNIVIATDREQHITKGILCGIKGDSIYLSLYNKIFSLNLKNLLTLSIEDRRTSHLATVSGALSGMYLGSLLFLTSKNQSAKYLEYDGNLEIAIYELLFVTIGGGIGYLIDRSSNADQEMFYFNHDEESADKEIKRLKNLLTDNHAPRKMHLSIHLSQVNSAFSAIMDKYNNSDGHYYYNVYSAYELHSFNLIRKLSLTYEYMENLEMGVALSWFGEPNFTLQGEGNYNGANYTSSSISQTYDGLGYYLISNYKPLTNIIPDKFDLIIEAGIGFGKVNYNFRSETTIRNYPSEPIIEIRERRINKMLFSSLFGAELKYCIYPELSLSLQADYIYLPEKMAAIPEFGFEERSLGNFSFGLGLGANF